MNNTRYKNFNKTYGPPCGLQYMLFNFPILSAKHVPQEYTFYGQKMNKMIDKTGFSHNKIYCVTSCI